MFKGFACVDSGVCVECSLSDDCLRCYAFCKHSKSPIFNRDMRIFNRLPIYIGEDLIDNINRKAIFKDILMFDKNKLKSIEFELLHQYEAGRYFSGWINETYHWINKSVYPTGYRWIQRYNSLSDINDDYGVIASQHIQNYYKDTREAKKKFKNWMKSITHNRIVARFNLNMNMIYGDEDIKIRRFQPLQDTAKYWVKQQFQDYHPIRTKIDQLTSRYFIKKRRNYSGCKMTKVKSYCNMGMMYYSEVDDARIIQFERFKKLYMETNNKDEKIWYLMKMGMLCYKNYCSVLYTESYNYHFLGTLKSHVRRVNISSTLNTGPFHYSYDLRQNIYKICQDVKGEFLHIIDGCYDPYSWQDQADFENVLHTDITIPKINHLKWHYRKKVMAELRSKKSRIRSDCGRSRGQNIRTTNPYYCVFSLYPEVDIGLIYNFPESPYAHYF